MRSLRLAIFTFLGICSLALAPITNSIEALVDKTNIQADEIFSYTINIEGEFLDPKVSAPDFKNFKIISQQQSKNYSIRGKQKKIIFNITYQLLATKSGIFSIEPVTLTDGKKKYASSEVIIKVSGENLSDKKKILPFLEKGTEI